MSIYTVARYECAECDYLVEKVYFDDYTSVPICCECDCEVKFVDEREAEWVTVAAYSMSREYGGPEEGGWYYDAGTPMPGTSREFLREDFPAMRQYQELLDMRYEGSYRTKTTVESPARPFPTNRPRYC